jgi:hypothetical protein
MRLSPLALGFLHRDVIEASASEYHSHYRKALHGDFECAVQNPSRAFGDLLVAVELA